MNWYKQITLCVITLILLCSSLLAANKVSLGSGQTRVELLLSEPDQTILQYEIGSFESIEQVIDKQVWHQIFLKKEGISQLEGYPALPVLNRSIIIDASAHMNLELYDLVYEEMQLNIAPSKGVIARNIDPNSISYRFADVYEKNEFYPSQIATLSQPYIMRDYRGITVQTSPFSYNPVSQTLRIHKSFKMRIYADGHSQINTLDASRNSYTKDFEQIYASHFINWQPLRYTPVEDSFGKLLVICHSSFMTSIQPYINWKKQKGIQTELVEFSTIGNTATQLQNYIKNRYLADSSIAYIQLVGDAAQIPSLTHQGGASDPSFSLVAGNDNYPDIFIGRFSAQSVADLDAQINKTIAYERDASNTDTWLSRAMGIASSEGSSSADNGETDIQHMNIIRNKLLNYGYSSVDQIYDPGATASAVTTNVNAGRGVINYVGHGSDTSWGTTNFSTTHAAALSNGYKTPVIMDVACVNGNFVNLTCFAEAWQRNPNGGSVAIYASSINQSWASPMRAQDEFTDLMVGEQKFTAGGLYYNSSCKMMDHYGNDGVNMFKTWHIFGDASLMVRSKTPTLLSVNHSQNITQGTSIFSVNAGVPNALVALSYNNHILGRGYTNASGSTNLILSDMPNGAVELTLTVSAHNKVTYITNIHQIPPDGPWIEIQEAAWIDNNNDQPDYGETAGLSLRLKNSGTVASGALSLSLSSSTAGVTITDSSYQIANISAGASLNITSAFGIRLADNLLDGSSLNFSLEIVGSSIWTHDFHYLVNAPLLSLENLIVDDNGANNNGSLDPGEDLWLKITVLNSGAATSPPGSVSLYSSTSGISISTPSINFLGIPAQGSTELSFPVHISASVAQGSIASFEFSAITGAYYATQQFYLQVGAPTEVTIGTGTNTQTYPLNRFYSYSVHESIYLASEIGMGGKIKNIAFYKNSGNNTDPIENVKIYMKHSTQSSLASGTYSTSGYTLVYDNSFPNDSISGWKEVELNPQFEYNGTSNLGILIIKGYQDWTSYFPNWRYTTASPARARQAQSDSSTPSSLSTSNNLPNIRFKIFPLISGPMIAANPSSITASLFEDENSSASLTLMNNGNVPLNWTTSAHFAAWGSLSPNSGSIPAFSSVDLSLSLDASGLNVGYHLASIVIDSDAANQNPFQIPVSLQVQSSPYPPSARLVAEWEPAKAVIVRYPLGLPYSLLADISSVGKLYVIVSSANQNACHNSLNNNGVNMGNVVYINASSDSYWVRDYAPWFVFDDERELRLMDFKYNRPRPNDNNIPSVIADNLGYAYHYLPLVATGGNMMTDGYGKMMSTNLIIEENDGNPGTGGGQVPEYTYTVSQIEDLVHNYLGVSELQLYQDPNNSYIDHIDCWAKLLDVDKVIIRSVPPSHAQYAAIEAAVAAWQSKTSSYGSPYRIYRVYTPNNEPYANSLIFNKHIYLPLTGGANDAAALQAYRNAMPGYTVSGYQYTSFESTDALHCRTNAIFDEEMIHLNHIPVSSAMESSTLNINVNISCINAIDASSSYVGYRFEDATAWQYAPLNFVEDTVWQATIPTPNLSEQLQYYIHAKDISARESQMPLCGELDPFALIIDQAKPTAPILSIETSDGVLRLSWDAVLGATYYKVYKALEPHGEYELLGQTTDAFYIDAALEDRAFYKVVSGF